MCPTPLRTVYRVDWHRAVWEMEYGVRERKLQQQQQQQNPQGKTKRKKKQMHRWPSTALEQSPEREVPSVKNFLARRIGAVSRETISSSLIFLVLKEAGYCTFLCCIWPASKTPDPQTHFLLKGQFSSSWYFFIWFDRDAWVWKTNRFSHALTILSYTQRIPNTAPYWIFLDSTNIRNRFCVQLHWCCFLDFFFCFFSPQISLIEKHTCLARSDPPEIYHGSFPTHSNGKRLFFYWCEQSPEVGNLQYLQLLDYYAGQSWLWFSSFF